MPGNTLQACVLARAGKVPLENDCRMKVVACPAGAAQLNSRFTFLKSPASGSGAADSSAPESSLANVETSG